MRKLATMLVGSAAVFAATGVSAQGTTAAASASITIGTLLSVSVDQPSVTFPQPTFADYDAGEIAGSVTSAVSTRGNVSHDVTIAADAAQMTYSGTETPPAKPSTDLQWSNDGGASWFGLSTTAANVATALPQGTNPTAATVAYQILLDEANDYPGTYSLNFTYTVVAN
ncbi:MAG TPA: hypothetical protein VMM12_06265 [Longimicrobiales bacterium]|nr:hypothetical protein [Longimicrobiales bacterium]